MRRCPLRSILAFCAALGVLSSVAVAGEEAASFSPNVRPALRVAPIDGAIRIDGLLDDDGWKNAARAGNFAEISPGDQVRPQADTEVLVTYDRSRLYIAFFAHDDPSAIRATLRARDEIFNDDYVGIILDTYDNTAWAYELFVNPLGIQGDKRWTLSEEDEGSDVEYGAGGQAIRKGV